VWAHIVLCNFIAYISMYDPHHRQDTSQVVPWLQENSLWPMIHPQSLAITNQFSIILSFPECYINGNKKIKQNKTEKKKHVVKHRRLLLITKHIHLKLMILVLLYVWEDVRVSMCAKSLQSCPPLCNPIDCSLPGSSVHEILQAWRVEWVSRLITIIPLLFSLAI